MTASVSSSNRFPEIEKYELLEEIGHGGMATVYRARDLRLGREVAVKVIHKHLRENVEVRSRFVAEARAVAKLRHPGIVDVYDVSAEDDEERYLVVELIRGKSLRQLLQDRGVLPAEIAATMVAHLCDAVEHAHASSVIHRDIKPENVLIELPTGAGPTSGNAADSGRPSDRSSSARSGGAGVEVKLTDFGIAKVLDAQGVTSTGQILGSPAHMAPEQIEGGEVGPHTDVFALGVLLYECMVGHLPFEGKNPAQVLRRVLEGDYEPADSERAEVGGRWSRILAAALAKDIGERLASASELGDLIEQELAALGIDDPNGDLNEYFADPKGYGERVRDRMVPRLLARGEQERKKGNAFDAAADFNRALALRPDDLAILKRVSALSAERVWRERALRFGAIVLGAAALGGGAFAVTKVVSGQPVRDLSATTSRVLQPSATIDAPQPDEVPEPQPIVQADASADPSADPSASALTAPGPAPAVSTNPSATVSSNVPEGELKSVQFRIWPAAMVQVAGQSVGAGGLLKLPAGTHEVSSTDPCCERYAGSVTVDGAATSTQVAKITLVLKPATVSLNGAPPGAYISCKGVQIVDGASAQFQLSDMSEQLTCVTSTRASKTITVTAGRMTAFTW